ncbi:MAG TPA: hypothetical protein VF997_10010, partial [Polyangia bacterium]
MAANDKSGARSKKPAKKGAPARAGRPAAAPTAALAARFALDSVEGRILALAWESERGATPAALTVRKLRALVGGEVDAALSPRRALRRHALVAVGAGGMAAADDGVR